MDGAGRWVGLAGGISRGDRGADAELISMWVDPDSRGERIGQRLVSAVVSWAEARGASTVGLWVNETNQPAIGLYEAAGFRRTCDVGPLPSDPLQQEIRMILARPLPPPADCPQIQLWNHMRDSQAE